MSVYHKTDQGECLSTIGQKYRFQDYRTIYDHPKNGPLKKKRPNPNVLLAGDCVYIPDKEEKHDGRTTDQRHIHEVKRSTVRLRVRLLNEEEKPFAGRRYELKINEMTYRGCTSSDGMVDETVDTDAREARLSVCIDEDDPDDIHEMTLAIGQLAPVGETVGAQARLNNLGYFCGACDGIVGPRTTAAVRNFQAKHNLTVDGIIGPVTRAKLEEIHGS